MLFSRTDRSFLGQWWWTVDRPMMAALLALAGIGIVMVTTASPPVAAHLGLGDFYFLKRHFVFLIPSIFILIGISMLSPRLIWRMATIVFFVATLFMIAVLFFGMEIKGARRWIHVLGFSLQPSEFIKPAFAVVSAWFMARQKEQAAKGGAAIGGGYAVSIILYGISVMLLLMQPDLGMTIIVSCIFMTQIFLAGFPFRWVFVLIGMAVGGMVMAYMFFSHVRNRVDMFFDPSSGDNYQVDKSLEAFKNGGVFGTGPGQGEIKLLLPDAHADFIFAVAGEEMGLLSLLIIVGLFFFVLYRGFNRLMESNDMFSVLAVGGLLAMFGLQAFVHMGSSLHLLPTKGMTLPLISYGGSSMLSICLSMGIVLALTRKQVRASISKGGLSAFHRRKMVGEPNNPAISGEGV